MTSQRLLMYAIIAAFTSTLINSGMAVRYAVSTSREVAQLRDKLRRCVWIAPEAERAP